MSITLTPKLKKEYEDLFTSCVINQVRQKDVEKIRYKIGLRSMKGVCQGQTVLLRKIIQGVKLSD